MASTFSGLSGPDLDTTRLPAHSGEPRCHLLHLASETLHRVCDFLETEDDCDDLASLCLTCRGLKSFPEEHLLRIVYLDRRFDSLERLQGIASHPILPQYVQRVEVQLEAAYENLDRSQWNEKLNSYGKGTVKHGDDRTWPRTSV